jgi:hypothetical protein
MHLEAIEHTIGGEEHGGGRVGGRRRLCARRLVGKCEEAEGDRGGERAEWR